MALFSKMQVGNHDILTFVPFDLDAVDANLLSEHEKDLLNTYHQQVYDTVSPYLDKDEREWLKKYTRKI